MTPIQLSINNNNDTLNKSMLLANYGTNLINANELAKIRSTGNFNPAPTYELTTDRGSDYRLAYSMYENKKPEIPNPYSIPKQEFNNFLQYNELVKPTDINYVVGSSNVFDENPNDWNIPDFACSRGSSQYVVWASKALKMTPTVLMLMYFSKENVDYLLDTLTSEVYRIRSVVIKRQNVDTLLNIMVNLFEYAIQGWLPHSGNLNKPYPRGDIPIGSEGPASFQDQLLRLNKSTMEELVKQVLSGIDMYKQYYMDASSLPMPLTRPVFTSEKGSRVLSQNIGFHDSKATSKEITDYNERYNILRYSDRQTS